MAACTIKTGDGQRLSGTVGTPISITIPGTRLTAVGWAGADGKGCTFVQAPTTESVTPEINGPADPWWGGGGGGGGGSDWKADLLWPLDGVTVPPNDPHASIIAGFNYGNKFTVNTEGTIEGIRFWRTDTDTITSRKLSIIFGMDGTTVLGEVTTTGETAINDWVYAQLPTPIQVFPGASDYVIFNVAANAGRQSALVGGTIPEINYTGGGFVQDGTNYNTGTWSTQTYFVDIGFKPVAARSRSAPKTKAAKKK